MTARTGRRTLEEHCMDQWIVDGATVDGDEARSIGRRIADARKARGLTQEALAQRSAVSVSLLRKVEQGSRDATPAITAAVAKALGVDVTSLTGQPYDQHGRRRDRIHTLIPALRRALTYWDLPPELPTPPRSWPELEAAARTGVGPTRIEPDRRPWLRPPPLPESCCTCSHGRYWPGRYPPDGFLAAAAVPGPM